MTKQSFFSMNKKGASKRIIGVALSLMVIAMILLSGPATAFDLQLGTPSDTTPTQGDSVTFTASAEIIANEIVPIQNLSLDFSDGTVCYFSVGGEILTPDDCAGITITLEGDTTDYISGDLNFTAAGTNYSYGSGFGYGYVAPGPSQLSYEVTLDTEEFARGDLSFTLNAHVEGDIFTSDEQSIDIKRSSGGGGGGINIVYNPSNSQSWAYVAPDSATFMKITSNDFGIKEITFSISNSANGVKITIEKLLGKPADVAQDIIGKVFKYLKITKVNLNDANINGMVNIKFQVTKSWLTANGIDAAKIVLKRYVNNEWVDLKTTLLSTDALYAYYEAESPGFSYFAIAEGTAGTAIITAAAPVPKAPETTVTEPAAEQPKEEEPATAEQPPVATQPDTEEKTETPATQEPNNVVTFVFMLVIVLALVIGVIVINGKRKKRSRFKTLQNDNE
jgi:PGF-pre-PGF domain-containing protein